MEEMGSVNAQAPTTKVGVLLCDAFLVSRRVTGRRSSSLKEQSKYNATKHGILSRAVLLKSESREEYDSILKELRDDLQPVGGLENILVEKLATLLWRYRRLLIAEAAEIRRNSEFLGWSKEAEETENAIQVMDARTAADEDTFSLRNNVWNGLIRHISNPRVLTECIERLTKLWEDSKAHGIDVDLALDALTDIYGQGEYLPPSLREIYLQWKFVAVPWEPQDEDDDDSLPRQSAPEVLEAMRMEIDRLIRYRTAQRKVYATQMELAKLCAGVPEPPHLDRILRYQTELDRSFDRVLSQLERRQRFRLGYPTPPSIKVDLSAS